MRILLAEDEKALSRVLVTIFEKNNYSVDPVYDGEDALAYLQDGNYDVAVLDIMMPKMDGITVLRKLRESGSVLPVLMLTAKVEVEDKVLGLDTGANDYLAKPFDTKELLARIRAITRNQTAADNKLRMGNISLDSRGNPVRTVSSPSVTARCHPLTESFLSIMSLPTAKTVRTD